MSIALATPESCPYCCEAGTAPAPLAHVVPTSPTIGATPFTVALCLMCASPLRVDESAGLTMRSSEREARELLSAKDWSRFEDAQRRIRQIPSDRRLHIIAEMKKAMAEMKKAMLGKLNANVEKAINDFTGYLSELKSGCSVERVVAIRREAVVCRDLMYYSTEVADTKSPRWTLLSGIVHDVLVMTSHVG
jgi:hypothetical protein